MIDQARRAGATWAGIASALGLASRQAAEQRRLRLATVVSRRRQQGLDDGYPPAIKALRRAVADLDRRVGADRRWDRRFTRAALVRMTLSAARTGPPGALFALAGAAVEDLADGLAPGAGPLPRATREAVDLLTAALENATPKG